MAIITRCPELKSVLIHAAIENGTPLFMFNAALLAKSIRSVVPLNSAARVPAPTPVAASDGRLPVLAFDQVPVRRPAADPSLKLPSKLRAASIPPATGTSPLVWSHAWYVIVAVPL